MTVFLVILVLTSCDESADDKNWNVDLLWMRHLGSRQNDIGNDAVVDFSGIYVAGVTLGSLDKNESSGEWDIFLAKYTHEGVKQWTRQWGTPGRDEGLSAAIGLDGCIYVTGYVSGSLSGCRAFGGNDIFLSKFSTKGENIWTIQWGTEDDDEGRGVTVTSEGIYITGFTYGNLGGDTKSGKSDIFLTKVNPAGDRIWTRQMGTVETEWGNDITSDITGLYVTGFTMGKLDGKEAYGYDDSFLIKYDFEGTMLWLKQWGTSGNDEGSSIALDSSGVYVCGRSNGNFFEAKRIGKDDAFLVKFDMEGNHLWTNIEGTRTNDRARGVTVNSNGKVCITGVTGGTLNNKRKYGTPDIFIILYDSQGNKELEKQFETGGFDFPWSAVFYKKDLYITGDTSFGLDGKKNENDNRDIFIFKLRLQKHNL